MFFTAHRMDYLFFYFMIAHLYGFDGMFDVSEQSLVYVDIRVVLVFVACIAQVLES